MIIFITGGARSGKSDFAQDMAEKIEGKRLFLATAQAFDEEMEERIQKHREQRGDRWNTIEESLYIGNAIRSVLGQYKTILVDCLTVWMSNLLMEYPNQNEKISEIVDDFFFSLDELEEKIIIVSNEVGMGISVFSTREWPEGQMRFMPFCPVFLSRLSKRSVISRQLSAETKDIKTEEGSGKSTGETKQHSTIK